VPYRLLRCHDESSVGATADGNLLVEGDNLHALKALLPYYAGKVKCIYIAVGVIQSEFLQQDHSLVLWLTPTDTIKGQTLAALRNREHPYRQALDSAVRGPVQVLELAEAFEISRAALDGATTIIVSTIAAVRVEDTEGRRIYEQNGALMPHFDKDGRTLVVEYKGGQLLGGPDTREKDAVGKLWEARSGGKCVFRLVSAGDYEAQLRVVAG